MRSLHGMVWYSRPCQTRCQPHRKEMGYFYILYVLSQCQTRSSLRCLGCPAFPLLSGRIKTSDGNLETETRPDKTDGAGRGLHKWVIRSVAHP